MTENDGHSGNTRTPPPPKHGPVPAETVRSPVTIANTAVPPGAAGRVVPSRSTHKATWLRYTPHKPRPRGGDVSTEG